MFNHKIQPLIDFAMWNFLQPGHQEANIPALKEAVNELISITKQKTAGQRDNSKDISFDINHAFTRWNIFGNNAYLSTYPANPNYAELLNPNYDIKGQKMISSHVEEILKRYPDYYGKMTWDEYVDLYKKMYGKDIYVIQETIHR
ncbi:hypothetical protein [Hungatella hathewayi]|uniref:hypothetical protein n=1 Tax=Hungatella hathewayi TaxID=154046 RepID=UPI003564CB9E